MKETLLAHLIGSLVTIAVFVIPFSLYALSVLNNVDVKVENGIRSVLSGYEVIIEQ